VYSLRSPPDKVSELFTMANEERKFSGSSALLLKPGPSGFVVDDSIVFDVE